MKRHSFIYILFFLLFSSTRAQEIQEVKSTIQEVTVFLAGAQITHEATVTVKAGTTELVFKGLSSGINAKSIQVSAPDEILINSAVHAVNYLKEHTLNANVIRWEDSLKLLKRQVDELNNEIAVYESEKNMILANKALAGEKVGVSPELLQKAADFFRTRLMEVYAKINSLSQKRQELNEKSNQLTQQINQNKTKDVNYTNDIVVSVSTFQPKTFTMWVNYFTGQAGWVPRYDLRVKNTTTPAQLDYRADVHQTTGLDWKQVKLTLSSANPNLSGSQPVLSPWELYTYAEMPRSTMNKAAAPGYMNDVTITSERSEAHNEKLTEDFKKEDYGKNLTLANYTQMVEATTTVEFQISLAQDIPTDGKFHQVTVQSSEVPAYYQHFAVPKLDNDAFLLARVTGWEKLNLLPGNANIFFEGTYVGESFIDPQYTKDTLDFSLGRDKKVVISRDQIKDKTNVKFIGLVREKTFAYDINVRNTKKESIHITIIDQVPISQDEAITVKVEDVSGALQDKDTGKLTWELVIPPSETRKISLIFSVKHPRNKSVPGV